MKSMEPAAVFAQTNDARGNELVAFTRDGDGRLTNAGSYPTGGRGRGMPHVPSQGSIAIDAEGQRLLLANAGSDELSLFSIGRGPTLLATRALGRRAAGQRRDPRRPRLRAERRQRDDRRLHPHRRRHRAAAGPLRALAEGRPGADRVHAARRRPRHHGRATNSIIVQLLGEDGLPAGSKTYASAGVTPYGFDFAGDVLVVTEAFGGQVGAAAASSYALDGGALRPLSPSVGEHA